MSQTLVCAFKNLIKQPTCYKNPVNSTCIDMFLTNALRNFQSICVLETRLSDFHFMTLTLMVKSFKKLQPRIINYRLYKNLLIKWVNKSRFCQNDKGFEKICNISMKVLNKHAPQKKKIVRDNQMPFMTKHLSKEKLKRSRLRYRFLINKSLENWMPYTQQRNYCVSLLRKTLVRYYANLNEKKMLDNKQFWKVVNPFVQINKFVEIKQT